MAVGADARCRDDRRQLARCGGCCGRWQGRGDDVRRLAGRHGRTFEPPTCDRRSGTSMSTPPSGAWRCGPNGIPSSSPGVSSSRGCSAAECSNWRCPLDRWRWRTAWTAGWRSSSAQPVISAPPDGCGHSGRPVSTSTAAAIPVGYCPGHGNPACTWRSHCNRGTSKSSFGQVSNRTARSYCPRRADPSATTARTSWSRTADGFTPRAHRSTRPSGSMSTGRRCFAPTTYSACGQPRSSDSTTD